MLLLCTGPGAARNGLLKLAERMIRHFNFNIFSNMESAWRAVSLPGEDDILIKTSFNLDDVQIPPLVAVSIATSVWLPVKQIQVFNFLRNEHNRTKVLNSSYPFYLNKRNICIQIQNNSPYRYTAVGYSLLWSEN